MRVLSAFPSPLGLGLYQFESQVQRESLLDASPIQFGMWLIHVQKHDEARNLRACAYNRESWIMFLSFPLDYQLPEFVRAAVAPFGHLLNWLEGPTNLDFWSNVCFCHQNVFLGVWLSLKVLSLEGLVGPGRCQCSY